EQGIRAATGDVKVNLEASVSELSASVSNFSKDVKGAIDQVTPDIKNVSLALEAGEKIGKYRNILPLMELLDDGRVNEGEALIAMWNVSSRFNTWVSKHYAIPRSEISEPLKKLISSINEEIQRVKVLA
ncbi:MAG: hypothetical protein ACREBS_04380, partial [Nitrososphaerales archaeon]